MSNRWRWGVRRGEVARAGPSGRALIGVCGVVLAGLLLAGCIGVGGPAAGGGPVEPEQAGESPPATGQLPEPTGTPAPFKTELVLCAVTEPASLLGDESAVAGELLPALVPQAAVFGEGYTATSDLLAALPSPEDGTLRRNEDGTLTVTLRYRDDLVWSDGEPFTADDALLGLSLPAPPSAPMFDVLEAQPVDDLTLEVTAAPGAEYPYVPSQPPLPVHVLGAEIAPAAFLSGDYARMPDPTLGPYSVSGWVQGSHILLQANPYSSGVGSRIPVVRVRFLPDSSAVWGELTSGGCDLALEDAFTLDQLPALLESQNAGQLRAYVRPGSVYERVIFNTYPWPSARPPYFADARVRQAFAYAVDRDALAQGLFGGAVSPLDSWLPPDHWAYAGEGTLPAYPFDPGRAAALLEEAGWSDLDGDGTREYSGAGGTYACQRGEWTIEPGTLLAPMLVIPAGDPLREQIALQMQASLAQVGVNLQVQPLDPALMFAASGPIVRREFDLALFAALTRPDPGGIEQWVGADVFRHPLERTVVHRWDLESRWLTSEQLVERLALNNVPGPENDYQGQNYSGWCNEAADVAIVEAALSFDLQERAAFYAQQQAIFAQELPVLPLFPRPRLAASAPYVCGVRPGPYDPLTWNIATWSFDESGTCGG